MAFCVFLGIWQVYNTSWTDLRREITYLPPSTEPYTPLTGNTEITGVTGSTLPNGVLTDRVENQIKKASVTFELVDRVCTHCSNKVKIKVTNVQPSRTWLETRLATCDYLHDFLSITGESELGSWQTKRGTNSTALERGTFPRLKKCSWQQVSCGLCKPAD